MGPEEISIAKGNLNYYDLSNRWLEFIIIYFVGLIAVGITTVIINYLYKRNLDLAISYFKETSFFKLSFYFLSCLLIPMVWNFRRNRVFKNSNLSKEQTYIIKSEGIYREINKNILFIKWENIGSIAEHQDMFIINLVYDNKKASIIPQDLFVTKDNTLNVDRLERLTPICIPKRFF